MSSAWLSGQPWNFSLADIHKTLHCERLEVEEIQKPPISKPLQALVRSDRSGPQNTCETI